MEIFTFQHQFLLEISMTRKIEPIEDSWAYSSRECWKPVLILLPLQIRQRQAAERQTEIFA